MAFQEELRNNGLLDLGFSETEQVQPLLHLFPSMVELVLDSIYKCSQRSMFILITGFLPITKKGAACRLEALWVGRPKDGEFRWSLEQDHLHQELHQQIPQ